MSSVIPTLIPSLLVDGSGYRLYSFTFWPLVVLEALSRVSDFDSLHLVRNLQDRPVARMVPMTLGF